MFSLQRFLIILVLYILKVFSNNYPVVVIYFQRNCEPVLYPKTLLQITFELWNKILYKVQFILI